MARISSIQWFTRAREEILLTATLAEKNRADSRHLPVVRCRADRQVKRLRETRNGREADQSDKNEKDLFDGVRSDAYENHNDYGLYEQRPCQSRVGPLDLLGMASFSLPSLCGASVLPPLIAAKSAFSKWLRTIPKPERRLTRMQSQRNSLICHPSLVAAVNRAVTDKIESHNRFLRIAWWVLAAIILGLTIAIRIRLLGIPLERDEGEYAYSGQLMLQGIRAVQTRLQHEVPRNLCRLCGDHVDLRTNASPGFIWACSLRTLPLSRSSFFLGPQTAEFDRRNCCCRNVCDAFNEPVGFGFRCSCNALRGTAGARRRAALASPAGSTITIDTFC